MQRFVRFDECAGAGIDDADSVRGPEPDPAFGVAAAAQEFRGVGQRQRVADVQAAVVFENPTSVYPPPQKSVRIGFQHGWAVPGRVPPFEEQTASAVEKGHSAGAGADDVLPVQNRFVEPLLAEQFPEAVEPRIVGADSSGGDDPQRAAAVDENVGHPVAGERRRVFRFVLVVIIELSVVAAEPVIGGDPDVAHLVLREAVDRQVGEVVDELRARPGSVGAERHRPQKDTLAETFDCTVGSLSFPGHRE